ncbi:MAG: hypothetical protein K9L74_04895 [Candidatus Izimaplasma sp.]|nr:hypothetical protein [Candidatus Izimaplasma bacterium]
MDFVKTKDRFLTGLFILYIIGLVVLFSRSIFLSFYRDYPLLGGFIKFFFLASSGDLLSVRFKKNKWDYPNNFFYKALIWGLIGIFIVIIFGVFTEGITTLQTQGILPFKYSTILTAFLISFFLNTIFAPTMMIFHRVSDYYIDHDTTLLGTIDQIDWQQFFSIVIFKTIPFFWIPAHTITFLLPSEYRVIFAAILGIFLGFILNIFKK